MKAREQALFPASSRSGVVFRYCVEGHYQESEIQRVGVASASLQLFCNVEFL